MSYCFYCNKEVDDMYKCPECGRRLLPDVNFMDHEETNEERLLKQIRRKKLEEAYRYETNPKMFSDIDFDIPDESRENSIPNNFTSVRYNSKKERVKNHPEWETEEVVRHPFLKGFRYVLLFFSVLFSLMILEYYGYTLKLQNFNVSLIPDLSPDMTVAFIGLIFIFMIILPFILIIIATGSSYEVRKRK